MTKLYHIRRIARRVDYGFRTLPPWLLLLSACASAPPQPTQPIRSPFAVTADSVLQIDFRETVWGIEVLDQTNNRVIFSENPNKHFIPASNTKLVVTTVAMGTLGPDFRYRTPLFLAGAAGDTAPRGLLIVGQGDPTMSGRFFGDDFAVVNMLADSLKARGVRRIDGDIVVDASYFTPDGVHSSWETGDLPWYYAAPTAALAIGEAALRLVVTAGTTVGATPSVAVVGSTIPMPFVVQATTDTANARSTIDVDYEAWPETLVITGRIGLGKADSSWIAVPDPATFAAQSLQTALAKRGVVTTGTVRVARDSASALTLRAPFAGRDTAIVWTSAPVRQIVGGILKPSQNWIAEQLLRTLGAHFRGEGSWSAGLNVERRYLIDVVRIDSLAFSLRDASGLSAQNLLSPHATLMLLEHARTAPWGADYRAALPTPGMPGSTLSNRLAGLESRLAAKTGTIANVNSLSGYLRTADNRDLTFVIFTNASGRASGDVRRGIDRIVNALARSAPTL
ncbi:MAG TPA: D-alanyl-D-alanine carboxypeptidase/D-alanyl-D-alanine-endopeptidase [Longimicrobiales bacterium]